jgi:hypothetical protein
MVWVGGEKCVGNSVGNLQSQHKTCKKLPTKRQATPNAQPHKQLTHCAVAEQINVLVLHHAPQPPGKDIVKRTPPPIHADRDLVLFEHARKRLATCLVPRSYN